MASEKTWRRKSTSDELDRAIISAVKAMKGSSFKITPTSIAERVSGRVPESRSAIANYLYALEWEVLRDKYGFPEKTPTPRTAPKLRPAASYRWQSSK